MTDGERKKFDADLGVLQIAVRKTPRGSAQEALYAAMAMVLGAVLGDEVYLQNYETVLKEIRSFGVSAVRSFGPGAN